MITRTAEAQWDGKLRDGKGTLRRPHGCGEESYSFGTRFGQVPGTNPEELIGAAHAGCFSMALAGLIEEAGFTPERVHTRARVQLDKKGAGFAIIGIDLETEARVPGMERAAFTTQAEAAKRNCPVSQALAAVPITLTARLL